MKIREVIGNGAERDGLDMVALWLETATMVADEGNGADDDEGLYL